MLSSPSEVSRLHLKTAPLVVDAEPELVTRARRAAALSQDYAERIQKPDGHWCGELESNASITAEWVLLYQALGLDLSARREPAIRYFFSVQKEDGSWGIAYNTPGDVSTTAEAYLALRILSVPVTDPRLQRAERFILARGGLAEVRVFTRIFLALFGLLPWSAVPTLPAEFLLLPPSSPINVYALSSWARGTLVPLLVLFHAKPLFALPNGARADNDLLDHLWLDPRRKDVPYGPSVLEALRTHGLSWKSFFTAADRAARLYDTHLARGRGPFAGVRERAVRRCAEWMLERQEKDGDWAGIFPPMMNVVLALHVLGHRPDVDGPMKRGLEAIERFSILDEQGFRVEACQSPVWDTVLMMVGLADQGAPVDLSRPRGWIVDRQILADYGDWKVYNPGGPPGGFSFEYANTWYPDVDDTAAIVVGLLKHDPASRETEPVRRAVAWMISMQNRDGGWAAFDRENDRLFLNQIPFSDMDALCDPSTPDVTGRVLEALGILGDPRHAQAVARGVAYLRTSQERQGSWFGRWGVNYIYGTSNVLCALARHEISADDPMVARALDWLESVQNADGGWGECLESYASPALMGKGTSTASQTAWAVMGLLAFRPRAAAVARGIAYLVDRQDERGTWEEREFTGTGFPNHFYLRYHLYRHYFPMMALGRYLAAPGAPA